MDDIGAHKTTRRLSPMMLISCVFCSSRARFPGIIMLFAMVPVYFWVCGNAYGALGVPVVLVGILAFREVIREGYDRFKILEVAIHTKGQFVSSRSEYNSSMAEYTFCFTTQDNESRIVKRYADYGFKKMEWGLAMEKTPARTSRTKSPHDIVSKPELEVDVFYDPSDPKSAIIADVECPGIYIDDDGTIRNRNPFQVYFSMFIPALIAALFLLLIVALVLRLLGYQGGSPDIR